MKKGFTFIEILVVITIIGIITAIGGVAYGQFMKQSRDAKRTADLEQIRAAIEMYRSNNASGLYPIQAVGAIPPAAICADIPTCSGNMYLSKTPHDPKPSSYQYYYQSVDGTTYTVGAYLELGGTSNCGDCDAVGSTSCNYCMGPYGQL